MGMLKSKRTIWERFSKKIRESHANHEGYIECPGCYRMFHWQEVDCGHFIENTERSKGWGGNALWYDPRNFSPQCRGCNTFNSAEAKRVWTADFITQFGREAYDELIELKKIKKYWTPEMVHKILENL